MTGSLGDRVADTIRVISETEIIENINKKNKL